VLGVTFWRDRSVLVTGATGLVGSALVPGLLEAGARVCVLVRDWDPQSELIRSGVIGACRVVSGRLESMSDVERALVEHGVETVFHLGAQTVVGTGYRSPYATFESNIRGSYTLFEACRRHADVVRRVVVASSDKAYGESAVLPYTEEMPARGRHPYDVSKSCADLLAKAYAHTYELPIVVARCGNVYGGGDLNWSRLIPGTIRSVLAGQAPVIRSDGLYRRDYVYVADAVAAYLALAERIEHPEVHGEAFNFGPADSSTVLQVAEAVLRLAGRSDLEPVIENSVRAEIRDQHLDSTKADRLLGWRPKWPLEKGLEKTIAWYRERLASSS
jgi:CDP-glucose 4,6-dehydratase